MESKSVVTQPAPATYPDAVQNSKGCISECSCVASYYYRSHIVQIESIEADSGTIFADETVNFWTRELVRN